MRSPFVSVVIPTYNRLATVRSAIDSVLRQTFSDVETIVVDDGSTDGTAVELKRRFGSEIRVITTDNRGVGAARNRGIADSQGKFLALLDSDDTWHPQKLEKQVRYHREHEGMRISQSQEVWIRNGKRVNPKRKHRKPSGDIFAASLRMCAISPSSVFLARDLFDRCDGFDEDLPVCEDYDLWLRIGSRMEVGIVDELLLTKYGGHGDQLSRRYPVMDRFRIYSLMKLALTAELNREQRRKTREVCAEKIEIVRRGMEKRGYPTSRLTELHSAFANDRLSVSHFREVGRELLLRNDLFR